MARKSYRTAQRNKANRLADAVEGLAPRAPRPACPTLLALAASMVEAHPEPDAWETPRQFEFNDVPHQMRRHNGHILLLAGDGQPGFPVGQIVAGQFHSMTDTIGFQQWLRYLGASL